MRIIFQVRDIFGSFLQILPVILRQIDQALQIDPVRNHPDYHTCSSRTAGTLYSISLAALQNYTK